MKRLNFSPVSRLSGLLSVEVYIDGKVVVDAKVKGNQFRGFEWMLIGHDIEDAPYFTERICGICSFAHGTVSNYLLDMIFQDNVPAQGQVLRNIMLACEFLQNHIRHFYVFSLPDFVRMPQSLPHDDDPADIRFSERENERLVGNYLASFAAAAKAHEAQTLFSGKAPHSHGAVHGGVTVPPTADKVMHAKSLIRVVNQFILEKLLPDTEILARTYSDYFQIGVSSTGYLSFGLFPVNSYHTRLWPAGRILHGELYSDIDAKKITEDISSSWFEADKKSGLTPDTRSYPDPLKPDAYTFVKAVQYEGLPYEGGPLARLCIRNRESRLPSTMNRIVARTIEAQRIGSLLVDWLDSLDPAAPVLSRNEEPSSSEAVALTDAPRGALLHQATVSERKITSYGIVTPTAWNFSPLNHRGVHGPVEQALIGTELADPDHPVELGRIIRAFDPCLSCGTHVIRL